MGPPGFVLPPVWLEVLASPPVAMAGAVLEVVDLGVAAAAAASAQVKATNNLEVETNMMNVKSVKWGKRERKSEGLVG